MAAGAPFVGAVVLYLARGRLQDVLAVALPAAYLALGLWRRVRRPIPLPPRGDALSACRGSGDAGVVTLRLDALSAILLLVVLIVGLLVMAFSIAYMGPRNREHPIRSTARATAATTPSSRSSSASMVGVALAGNLLVLFLFWECTTLCSWVLISHHVHQRGLRPGGLQGARDDARGRRLLRRSPSAWCSASPASFSFAAIAAARAGRRRRVVFVCLLVAASAKSAQVPLFTWLPDAMEAPTPISAYLHAAAMVKAGVYLMARVILDSGTFPGLGRAR